MCVFDEIVLWSHVSTPRVVVEYHTENFLSLVGNPCRPDLCMWCRYPDNGELKGVIGIHVGRFLYLSGKWSVG